MYKGEGNMFRVDRLIYILTAAIALFILENAAACAASNEVMAVQKVPDQSYVAEVSRAFDDAVVITVRYISKTSTYGSIRPDINIDLDRYWTSELKSRCLDKCVISEKWLFSYLSAALPSSGCLTMLSTYVEFEFPAQKNLRFYIDHAGYCIYVPSTKKSYFSKIRFNDAIKSGWGEGLRGM